ncbi:MAG: alpha amylase C-terminal domain-containing protein [Lachnospiraceae bacterium]|jgi:1,4-alpha-glucan branching enzyme|nr:alpha amylase C-terminal domain-containing protein [Lachnospiraceae bacterium]
MDRKLYELMNWPEIEAVEYAECRNPEKLLGGHLTRSGYLIQAFRPDAVSMSVRTEGKVIGMEKTDESGWFAALLPGKKEAAYALIREDRNGKQTEYEDPYAYAPKITNGQLGSLAAGNCENMWEILGNRVSVIGGHRGVTFAMWAPGAIGVSVVGDFNHFDRRISQMERLGETDVFALFIPGVKAGEKYGYEISMRGGRRIRKADPFARESAGLPDPLSIVGKPSSYSWKVPAFSAKREKLFGEGKPAAILCVNPDDFEKPAFETITKTFVGRVKEAGFSYVQFPPLTQRSRDGVGCISWFAVNPGWGDDRQLKEMVDAFHAAGIGVIAGFPAAFIPDDAEGLVSFNGSPLFETVRTRLDDYPGVPLFTFDYSRPQVCSFLKNAALYLAQEFHLDGLRFGDVASMLYLDYGKAPGEWQPNLYGGNENMNAAAFLKELNKRLHGIKGFVTLDDDTSAWRSSTGKTEESLGFDYKENRDFTGILQDFATTDPLFRKGKYDRLSETMLYHYMEDFELPFPSFGTGGGQPLAAFPEKDEEERRADLRALFGFFMTMPGIKSLPYFPELAGDEGWQKLTADFVKLYRDTPALHELDQDEKGFSWVQADDGDQTVLIYERRDKRGRTLLAACNFTPVQRDHYRFGIGRCGHFRVVLSTAGVQYGGKAEQTEQTYDTGFDAFGGSDYSLSVTLPGLSCTVFEFIPYTQFELENFRIRAEADKARKQALQEAETARERQKQAEEAAEQAREREKQTRIEAENALKQAKAAAAEAEKRAEETARAAEKAAGQIRQIELKEQEDLKKLKESAEAGAGSVRTRSGREEEKS